MLLKQPPHFWEDFLQDIVTMVAKICSHSAIRALVGWSGPDFENMAWNFILSLSKLREDLFGSRFVHKDIGLAEPGIPQSCWQKVGHSCLKVF